MANEVRKLRRQLERQGWTIVPRKSGAFIARSPDGETQVTIHATPGDHRAIRNTIARLKRGGFDPDA